MIHIFTKICCCLRPDTGEMAPLPVAHMLVERRRALPPHHTLAWLMLLGLASSWTWTEMQQPSHPEVHPRPGVPTRGKT